MSPRRRPAPHVSSPRPKPRRVGVAKVFRAFLFVFFFIVLLVVIAFFVFSRRSWDGESEKNFVIAYPSLDGNIEKIYFAQVNPQTEVISITAFPATMNVKVIGGYGEYPVRSVLPLLKMEKKSDTYLRAAYGHALQETVDEVWWSDNTQFFHELPAFPQLAKDLLLYRVHSSLTLADRLWLYRFAFKLRPDKFKYQELQSGEEWAKLKKNVSVPSRAHECSVAVVNATQVSGLGTSYSKVLEETGLAVVRITDTPQTEPTTRLLAEDPAGACATILSHISATVPVPVQPSTDSEVFQKYRSHVVLILGNDLQEIFAAPNKR